MQSHPAAEIFPLLTGAEFDALVSDIAEHGLREPIIIHDGQILDGRNRYAACQKLGIEPAMAEWDRRGTPEAFVVSLNLHRRHLNESQRAMIAARLATRELGSNQHHDEEGSRIQAPSQIQVANLLNVSRATVQEAKTVLTRGTPEEIEMVERGEIAASTIGRRIRKGESEGQRKNNREADLSQIGKNPERIQRQQINAEIWGRVRDALIHLTSLPLAEDVVAIARRNDKTGLIDARLSRALQWLKDFEHDWLSRDETAA